MIEFTCNRRHYSDQTPIITDLEIQDYAEMLLQDYKPRLLKEPGKVNAFHFAESYLGATLDYQDIYYNEGESPVAGATVFNDDRILVFDREKLCVRPIDVEANTILIDNSTMAEGKEAFATFTVLHEGGHFCMHPAVYRRLDGQLDFLDLMGNSEPGAHTVQCRRSVIEGKVRLTTQLDFREHQANTFAAAVAMPRPTFIPYAQSLIRKCGFKKGVWVEPDCYDWDSSIGLSCVVDKLADTFGVSRSAAKVQMKRQGLLMSEDEYTQSHCQLVVAF